MPIPKPETNRNVRHAVRAALAILLSLPLCAFAAPLVAPRPAPPPTELRLPPDIVYSRVVRADSAVTFSHTSHVEYESYRCTGCHPKLFHLLNTTRRASHREMDKGGSCGACHDGKHAFDVRATESCSSCHAGRRAAPAGAADSTGGRAEGGFKGPKAFAFKRGGDSPGLVTFRHATHLGRSMTCRSCHPKPFAMKGTAALPNGAMHEPSACGMCHDGKQSFSVEDDSKCVRCHAEGKAGQ
jgi:c(7)-type cytochrome triheme protein